MRLGELAITSIMNDYLTEKGYSVFPTEVFTKGNRRSELILKISDERFVIEVEIGEGYKSMIEGIKQAYQYSEDLKSQGIHVSGIISIVYPPTVRVTVRSEDEARKKAREIVEKSKIIQAMVLPPFIDFHKKITLDELLTLLEDALSKDELSINIIINVLREAVNSISEIILNSIKDDTTIINSLVKDFDHFKLLADDGELSNKEFNLAISRIGSYVLINQILFYHILSTELRKKGDMRLPEIKVDFTISDFIDVFDSILDINYEPIFSIKIIDKIPENTIETVRDCIRVIKCIKPEIIKHDLLGLVYHNLIPSSTRKKLAAFFTKPVAADILASLIISSNEETVLDPACGSGTLLSSAYRRKMDLTTGGLRIDSEIKSKYHKQFVEIDLTGIDIMPFSAHLTAMNLSIQAPLSKTTKLRVGVEDSLRISAGVHVGALVGDLAPLIYKEYGPVQINKKYDIDPFEIVKVDCIIMNPPFTRKRRLTAEMKIPIRRQWWNKLGELHYWAHFLLHSLDFLKENGKIGSVLPLGCIALQDGFVVLNELQKKGYKIKYIIKSMKDIAFSESAKFRDYLIIFDNDEKRNDIGFIYILKSLEEMDLSTAKKLGNKIANIKIGENYADELFSIKWCNFSDVDENRNLWELLELNDPIGYKIQNFYRKLFYTNPNITKFSEIIDEDIITYFSPDLLSKGVRHSIFLGRSKETRSQLIILKDNNFLEVSPRDGHLKFRISKKHTMPGLRSGSHVSSIDIHGYEYIIKDRYRGFEDIEKLFKSQVDFGRIASEINRIHGKLAFSRRFDFTAEGFRLFSFYSEKPFVTTENLWAIKILDDTVAKILSLWFNSTIFLISLVFSKRKETRGSFSQVDKYKILDFPVININKLGDKEVSNLLVLFEKVRSYSFPSLLDQIKNQDEIRIQIDKEFLKLLGFFENSKDKSSDIKKNLALIYSTFLEKSNELMEVMKQ